MANTTVSVSVMRHTDGEAAGTIDMPAAEWERYAAGEHPAYQWPEGVAEAGDVLDADDLDRLGLSARTVIWLD